MSLSSVIRYVRAMDTTSTTGAGKTGLAFGDITAKYVTKGGTLTSLTTETITTLGTYQAPTSSAHIRIKELSNADPCKGVYEVHFHDTTVTASGLKLWLFLSATGALFAPFELDLVPYADQNSTYAANLASAASNYSATRGLSGTALPAAAADAAGGLPISDAGGLDLDNRMPSSTAVTNLNTVFATDYATVYDATNKAFLAKLGNFAMGGSSLALTTGAISGTTLTFSGAVAFQSTFAVTTSTSLAALSATTITASGTTSLAAVTTSGTVTLNALTVTNATTLSGAVSLGSTLGITGAITATNASNNLTLGTFTVTTNVIAWNAAWDAEVQSEVDDALVAQRLDELLNADSDIDGAAPPTVGSVFHELMTKTTGSFTFDQTTDSLEALRDRGDSAWITATGFSTLTQADIRTAVGLASANLDTQLDALPTNSELATAITTGLTTALTEGYRGAGATGSVRDLLYEVIAHLGESAISSTTKTLKKLDGSTTAKTYTLDSATTPTSITETT